MTPTHPDLEKVPVADLIAEIARKISGDGVRKMKLRDARALEEHLPAVVKGAMICNRTTNRQSASGLTSGLRAAAAKREAGLRSVSRTFPADALPAPEGT